MERNYMNPESIVEFEYLEERTALPHEHENPELLFVLEGNLLVSTDMQEYRLGSEDFLLINAGRRHSYRSDRAILAVRFQISLEKLQEMLHRKVVIFHCASIFDMSKEQKDMRKILKDILFCNVNNGMKNDFYVSSLHYQLLSLLCGKFLLDHRELDEGAAKEKDRMRQVMDYIRANYRDPILLQDVADAMFLSPTYLSKYIRKNSGKGFVELINDVRLSHAMEDLIYTDTPVIKIAMDNGFASVAALNKVFKEAYQTTPSAYRKEKRLQGHNSYYAEQAAVYLHKHKEQDKPAETETAECSLALSGNEQAVPFSMKQIMNAGQASDLLRAATQEQIRYCRDHLGIRHVRFWNLFEQDMFMDPGQGIEKLNYGRLYTVLDFLTEEKMIPYIVLRSKHRKLLSTANKMLNAWEKPEDFSDQDKIRAFFDDFFGHLIRRYGRSEVSSWIFVYPFRAEEIKEIGDYELPGSSLWERYLEEFDLIAASFRKRFPDGMLGGADLPVRHFGQGRLEEMFKEWQDRPFRPDFISITSFPYQLLQEDGSWYEQRRTELDFAEKDVDAARAAMGNTAFSGLPLHLAECNVTLSDRAFVNDSLMRGAFLADTLIRCMNRVDYFGVWNALDSYSDYDDSSRYLFGGSGIMTKTGVPKPPAHVLNFLSRLYMERTLVKESCLVSFNEHRHYKMLVHHLVNMNTAYYLKEENELTALSVEQMTETNMQKTIHVKIETKEDGCWQIRRYCLNRHAGSILNEWLDLNIDFELRKAETRYLERICLPRLYVEKRNAEGGILEFDIKLEPNEVQYLHVTEFN